MLVISGPEEALYRWSGQVTAILPRRPLAQARKYLSYRKAWADLKHWSGKVWAAWAVPSGMFIRKNKKEKIKKK